MQEDLAANIEKYLKNNEYPGRVIIIGENEQGFPTIIYAIMGRSENSQNRRFERGEDNTIKTAPIDSSTVKTPELIIYNALTEVLLDDGSTAFIVTNGNQTDNITSGIKTQTFQEILRMLKHEPDAPNYTPRISGIIYANKEKAPKFSLSIIKSDPADPENNSLHEFFEELPVTPGMGFFISTYASNWDPLPTFKGNPAEVPIAGNAEKIANTYWNFLNPSYRVGLVVKVIDPISLIGDIFIINKET